jgi:DNA-nicking Smr family endonuclease
MSRVVKSAKPAGAKPAPLYAAPDNELWAEVTSTVEPLRKRSAIRSSAPVAKKAHAAAKPQPASPPAAIRVAPQPLRPDPRDPGGKPIEPGLRRKLVRERERIDATIDLHGMRQADAEIALRGFIRAAAGRGDRNVLVITGKGLRSATTNRYETPGVLRQAVPRWLGGRDLAPLIGGWSHASREHGGEGALYVRLKRR